MPIVAVIYVKSPVDVAQIANRAAQIALGQISSEAARGIWLRVGLQVLSLIKQAFVIKARGGTDAAGESWKPLAKSTVAYSRRHPGVLWPGEKRAPFAPSWMLTVKQRERWWSLYRSFGGGAPAGAGYHAKGQGGGWAAARAWAIVKAEGAKTLMSEYGDTPTLILRSTGFLLNSLSPGIEPDNLPPNSTSAPKVDEQVFNILPGAVMVGTNRKYAGVHHNGSKNGRIPQRRLWAKPENWPQSWWELILSQARQGLIEAILNDIQQRWAA